MSVKLLDVVALQRDIPEHGLRNGDVGAVVEVYAPDAFEVEFVLANGHTLALLTLGADEIRPVEGEAILAVRELTPA